MLVGQGTSSVVVGGNHQIYLSNLPISEGPKFSTTGCPVSVPRSNRLVIGAPQRAGEMRAGTSDRGV